jgi:hypothetical protein
VAGNKTTVLSIAGDWWYLDQIGCGPYNQDSWGCTYDVDFDDVGVTPAQRALLKGGETAMWGEGINAYNQDAFVWRGTSAAAERLWSLSALTPAHAAAAPRLVEHLCRLETLGVRAGPIQPGFCPQDVVMPSATAAVQAVNAALDAALAAPGGSDDDVALTLTLSREDAAALRAALAAAAL